MRRQEPLHRREQLTRTIQRDPHRERANTAVRSRVLDPPKSDKRKRTSREEDEHRILEELEKDLDVRWLRFQQHKLTVSLERPQQEVSPNRRRVQKSRSELTLSPKRQVYTDMRDKAAAARAAFVVEKLQRTEESKLDEEAILDNTDQPGKDIVSEREHFESELHSHEKATSVMDTDPPASTS